LHYLEDFKLSTVVYTAIFGNYDKLNEIENPQVDVDYFCITDGKFKSKTWQIMHYIPTNMDYCRAARYFKICPHRWFPEYDYSMWIDGNLKLRVTPDIQTVLGEKTLAVSLHPSRDCIYDEIVACEELNKGDSLIMHKQVEYYKSLGFPSHAGLWETNALLRRHNDAELCALNDLWWEQVSKYSKRDQLSFPFIFQGYPIKTLPLRYLFHQGIVNYHMHLRKI